jgi:hypothetical protein
MKKNLKVKIPKWITKIIPKMLLPSSGQISLGNVIFDRVSGDGDLTTTGEVYTADPVSMASESWNFSLNAEVEGTTSRANLLAAPYALSEFFQFSYNSCLAVGTNINMADGSTKFIEDLEEGDELLSVELPGMGDVYSDYRIYHLDNVKIVSTKVKQVVFDFTSRYFIINDKLKGTKHPTMAFRNNYYEWWQMSDLLVNDKLVTTDLSLDEINSVEKIDEEIEIVGIRVDKYNTYFAEGYLVHD